MLRIKSMRRRRIPIAILNDDETNIDIDINTFSTDTNTNTNTNIGTNTDTSSSSSSNCKHSIPRSINSRTSHSYIWPSRPSLDQIFACSNHQLHSLIINYPSWCNINTIYPTSQSHHNKINWSGYHLLSYAVKQEDVERIQILTQHPYQKLDVNQRDGNNSTALAYAVHKYDDVAKRLISLLASLGADPNDNLHLGVGILDVMLFSYITSVIPHFITTFHPINQHVTCTIPLDLTHTNLFDTQDGNELQPTTFFQRLQFYSNLPLTSQQFENIINNINQQLIAQQYINMHTFEMATHSRVGRKSAVYRVLRSSPLYDSHLLRLIWRFLYISETLPATHEQVETMERARKEKQQLQSQEQATND